MDHDATLHTPAIEATETAQATDANGHASPPSGRPSARHRGLRSGGTPGNRGGRPPLGNTNAATHGVRGFLTVGSMPAGCVPIQRALRRLRVALEDAVAAKHGEVDLYHGALIHSATRHEGRAQLLQRWLRIQGDERTIVTKTATQETNGATTKAATSKQTGLSLLERMAVLREIGQATDARDRCLRLLGLDRSDKTDIFAALYAPPQRIHDVPAPEPTE